MIIGIMHDKNNKHMIEKKQPDFDDILYHLKFKEMA